MQCYRMVSITAMALLALTEVHKSYGNQDVLLGASFFVTEGRRYGLVGPNGAGKTTLLRLITGQDAPDSGRVNLQPNAQTALLDQEPLQGDTRTVLEAAQRPMPELQSVWEQMTALEAEALHDEEALHAHDALHTRFQDLGGYSCENRAKEVLAGLGFVEDAWDKPVRVLSGGERTRLALVQILVRQPDLLLLDEPTNHVDWAAAEWLQEYLRRYPGSALIVSHDRYFLDEVADEIIELERGETRTYRGNYTAYSKKKAQEREQAEEAYRRQLLDIEKQQEIIQKFRSHRNFSGMHSREKTLEKLQQNLTELPKQAKQLKVQSRAGVASGDDVLSVNKLTHGFGERALFSGLNMTMARGERLAIIGPNGAGKTTLLKALAGELTPKGGSVSYGFRVQPAYFAQDLSSLDPELTVWETIWETGTLNLTEAMQALHQFLFMGDGVQKQVADLSGGERTRLALCKLLVTRPNLLFLDEPTNHLDIPSREAVESAIRQHPGAVVVVSHDRYFLDAVATRILELTPAGHRAYEGTYREYQEKYKSRPQPVVAARKTAAPAPPPRTRGASPSRRLPKVEAEIARLEARQKEITELLGDAAVWSNGRGTELNGELTQLGSDLEALYAEWEQLSEILAS